MRVSYSFPCGLHGLLARMIHPQQRLTKNAEGRMLGLMTRAGLAGVRKVGERRTLFGTVAFYQAARPA